MTEQLTYKQKSIELTEIGKQKLLETRGGCISEQEAADFLNVDSNTISVKRQNHKLLGIKIDSEFKYPLWQFNVNGILPGLDQILLLFSLEQIGTWSTLTFFIGNNKYLESNLAKYPNPIDALNAGKLSFVKIAAEKFVGIGM
jgi:hypothetical protein